MNIPSWLHPLARWLLGTQAPMRRHVAFVLAAAQLYAVNLGIVWHSVHLGLFEAHFAAMLTWVSVASYLLVFTLVRSGVTQRLPDPVLTLPHALVSIGLCILAYTQLEDHRASVLILVAEALVMSMFRLRPTQMLGLGLASVGMLLAAVVWLSWHDPLRYPASTGLMHFVIGGATLLILSLVAKWVTDIRMRIGQQARELSRALDTLQHMATQDTLTGLLNRRTMSDLIEGELKLTDRQGSALSVALIDLDHFKHINDHAGHAAGDAVLCGFAANALAQLRKVDKVSRWGGEEFLVLLPQVTEAEALSAIERLRQSTERLSYAGHPGLRATFSAGLAQAQAGESLEQLVERADHALYQAKREGRNRCGQASHLPHEAHLPQQAQASAAWQEGTALEGSTP
ncbi:MAG: GGDEF domain-containing protein [Proteobacteria bacterium]|uniref:GGDEF domain-containing protein n=1 Tax=Aquabacterium sp. TaxID=1872578 RepID=UPI0035C7356B|nr:GGDEF domain-containing protein [Pseudomonadota bacterium]